MPVTVNVFDPLTYNPLQDTTRACGKEINLNAGSNAISYKWNDSSTNQILTVNKSGFYKVIANKGAPHPSTLTALTFSPDNSSISFLIATCSGWFKSK